MCEVIESEQFKGDLKAAQGVPRGNAVLAGLIWAVSHKPDDFPVLATFGRLRLAKSEWIETKSGKLVRFYLWFAINTSSKVELLSLEIVPKPAVPYLM